MRLTDLHQKIDKISYEDSNSLQFMQSIEEECILTIRAADYFKQYELIALSLYVLGCFYQAPVKLSRVRLFNSWVSYNHYDNYLRAMHLYNACWNLLQEKNPVLVSQANIISAYELCKMDLIEYFLRHIGSTANITNIKDMVDKAKSSIEEQRSKCGELIERIHDREIAPKDAVANINTKNMYGLPFFCKH